MALAATAVIMNCNPNRRIDRSQTVGENLCLNWECSSLQGLCGWWKRCTTVAKDPS